MNLKLPEATVRKRCTEGGVAISAIEPLPAGGTHLVCLTGTGAETMRTMLADHIITGIVKRFPFFRA